LLEIIVINKIDIHLSIEFFEEHQELVRSTKNYPIEFIKKLALN
jgi:hypothetical protein